MEEKTRKRKKPEAELDQQRHPKSPKPVRAATTTTTGDSVRKDPYPSHTRPTPQECEAIRDTLLSLHGFPTEFVKYRKKPTNQTLQPDDDDDPPESVLDGLVRTVLSQNTTESNSQKAFASLKSAFSTWENVLDAESKDLENAIRCGGLAPTKAACIKNMLRCLMERKGKLCLEYLRDLSVDEVKAELSLFKGIGPKTLDDFPVDTHIFEIAKTIGWVPASADRNKTYLHLNQRITNDLKFDLNCLLYTHGKLCRKCTSKRGNQQREKSSDDNSCPLLNYCKDPV